MKKSIQLLTSIFLLALLSVAVNAQCVSGEMHNSRMQNALSYRNKFLAAEAQVQLYLQNMPQGKMQSNVYDIPVVVHVIHLGEAVGTGTNVSDATILTAIQALNNMYKNTNGLGVDMQINFCLAVRDPNGNPTTGINRVNGSGIANYTTGGINNSAYASCANEQAVKNLSKWPYTSYLNIWVVYKICGGLLGHSDGQTGSAYDGVEISYAALGTGQAILSHEVGHMFNLYHTFKGDENNLCPVDTSCADNGDFICDTPPHKRGDTGAVNPCSASGVWNNSRYNVMSYNYATPTARFTQGQKDRARAVLVSTSYHPYLNSNGCVPAAPNNAGIEKFYYPLKSTYTTSCNIPAPLSPIVQLKNYGTNVLTSATIKYKVDNNAFSTFIWNGNLLADATVDITLPGIPVSLGAHTFYAATEMPNGVIDTYMNNDTANVAFTFIQTPTLTTTGNVTNATCNGSNDGSATISATSKVEIKEDWEGSTDWTLAIGSEVNHWVIGNTVANGGLKSIYISNDNTTNSYNTLTTSITHFYKDFYFPPGATNIKIKFDWRGMGEFSGVPGGVDRFRVYMIAPTEIPSPGYQITSTLYLGSYFSHAAFVTDSIMGLDANAGQIKRLVFSWRNNYAYGTQTPAAIDNINVSYDIPATYSYAWDTNPFQTTATATGLIANNYNVVVTDANNCTANNAFIITQPPPISVNITANGVTTFCVGNSVTLNADTGFNSYVWSDGETTQSIIVGQSGNYAVTVTNAANCSASSAITSVVVNPSPTATITANGATTFCNGDILTLDAGGGYAAYLWSTGATTQSILVSASGAFTVTVTNANNCSAVSPATIVTVKSVPPSSISVTGSTSFCSGANLATLTANAGVGYTYEWKKGSSTIAGATAQNYIPTTTGSYKVIVIGANGCRKTSPSVAITVYALPVATITPMGATTFCAGDSVVLAANTGAGLTYQWLKNNAAIPNAILQNYAAKLSGTYKVIVSNANNCSKTSAGKSVSVNCKLDGSSATADLFTVYPNPNKGSFSIDVENTISETVTISIINTLGQQVYTKQLTLAEGGNTLNVEFKNYVAGIYSMVIRTQKATQVRTISIE